MSKFKRTLAVFLASLPYGAGANIPKLSNPPLVPESGDPDPVDLRPINHPGANIFAAHRSHSSHSSHRSSSGGGYTPAPAPTPKPVPAAPTPRSTPVTPVAPQKSQPVDQGRPALVSPNPAKPTAPALSTAEKLRLQIMRVQLALTNLGLYSGPIDGVLGDKTKEALKLFQKVKGLPEDGLMNTPTLNGLGVPAVQ